MDRGELLAVEGYELIETHISWVLIGQSHVYKVKRPVKFSFLDFSTLEKRKHFCEEELRLNRRLAPEVYLDVVPITRDRGKLAFGGSGAPEDYAVEMVRLDQSKMMDRLLLRGGIDVHGIRKLAGKVAAFHKEAELMPEYGSPDTVWSQIADLGSFRGPIEEAAGLGTTVDEVLEGCSGFIAKNRELIESRRSRGMVRDCHGDLHSGNVFFYDGIKIIDCIEFSKDFRCVDVVSDMAFMAMDLDYAGREDLSDAFVKEYVRLSGDPGVSKLLDFYKCYRANVRAKIAAIEWGGGAKSEERIRRYLALAHTYALRL
ncbi:MAG: hypothetical protein AB1295_02060 [Candidatus Micrarchaeota archaeon]